MGRPSLWFNLGRFVGDVARSITRPIDRQPRRQVLRHEVDERTTRQDNATVTLRRTTIEEIEVRPDPPGATP